MKSCRSCLLGVIAAAVCFAQSTQPPATAAELTYFKFILTTLAGPLATPDSVLRNEYSLAKQFDLNAQELTVIDSARQQMIPVLRAAQQAAQQIAAGKQTLSVSDVASIAAVDAQMDQQIATVANWILSSVRSQTAAALRMPGRIVNSGIDFAAAATQAQRAK